MEKYIRKGVNVYNCSNLHAKLYIFDKTLITGSANISRHSQEYLVEAGILCQNNNKVLKQALKFIDWLKREPVTPKFLNLRKRQYSPPKFFPKLKSKSERITVSPSLWVIGVEPLDKLSKWEEHLYELEKRKAK